MKIRIAAGLSILTVLIALRVMSRPIAGIHRQISETEQKIQELEERKRQIRALQIYLEKIRTSALLEIQPLFEEEDTALLKAGLQTFFEKLLRDVGLQGQVIVGEVTPSEGFPAFLKISELQVEVGLGFYRNYRQLLAFFAALQRLPLVVEVFCYGGCEDLQASGNPRIRLKFYLMQR